MYDIEEDVSESNNLVSSCPETAQKLKMDLFAWLDDMEANIPERNPDFIPWRQGYGSGKDVKQPFDMKDYDADVYYGMNMEKFH